MSDQMTQWPIKRDLEEQIASRDARLAAVAGLVKKMPHGPRQLSDDDGDVTQLSNNQHSQICWRCQLERFLGGELSAVRGEADLTDVLASTLVNLLDYLDEHDWGTVPEGRTSQAAREAVEQYAKQRALERQAANPERGSQAEGQAGGRE